MRTCSGVVLSIMLVLMGFAAPGEAQERKILSPRDSVYLSLDTNTISVNYGRPSMRGRKIMGELVPWNQVWRTGANQATHLKTNFDLFLGGVPLTRGTYTLWTLPSPTGWKIILNKQTKQWGTAYDASQDFARFDAKVETLPSPVDTFTIALERTGKTTGILKMMWEKTLVSAAFEKSDKVRPLSPLDSTEVSLDGKAMKITYSKPFVRGRTIWGGVVPNDSVWRAGANAATTFSTEADLVIGKARIPKGSYTLYTRPAENSFTLIINKKQGGPAQYDEKQNLVTAEMSREKASSSIDPLRIWFEPAGKSSAKLHIGWADRIYTATVTAQ